MGLYLYYILEAEKCREAVKNNLERSAIIVFKALLLGLEKHLVLSLLQTAMYIAG